LISYREVEKIVNFCLYASCQNGCPPIAEIWIGCLVFGPSGVEASGSLAPICGSPTLEFGNPALVPSGPALKFSNPALVPSGSALKSGNPGLIGSRLARQFDDRAPIPKL